MNSLLHLFLFLGIFALVSNSSNHSMISTWGRALKTEFAVQYKGMNWTQCAEECYRWQKCVVSYFDNVTCFVYNYTSMPRVNKTTSFEGLIISYKVDNSQKTCPVGDNAPTFGNENATGNLYIDAANMGDNFPQKVFYIITFVDNSWMTAYQPIYACADGANVLVTYPSGVEKCLLLRISDSTTGVSYETASAACQAYGGYLPAVNEDTDAAYFPFLIQEMRQHFKAQDFYIRIDGKRTPTCQSTPSSSACSAPAGFTFTDPNFSGNFNKYNWVTSPSARNGTDDDCVVYSVIGSVMNKTDVRSCTNLDTLQALGYFCMKPAWIS